MTVIGLTGFGANTPDPHLCSRAGCSSTASWAILWRNPKIHTADRVKTWLSCTEHEFYLKEFLAARSFPVNVIPISELEHPS